MIKKISDKMIEKNIKSIEFGLLSPEQVRKMSTVRIVTADTYSDDGYPIEGGLMDLRLGVIDPGLRCKTCGQRMNVCPGHFGSIELVRPVVHVGYVKMILTLLKSTCQKCGRILIENEKIEELKKLMLKEEAEDEEMTTIEAIDKCKKASKCPHCQTKQSKIKIQKPTTFNEDEQRLLPSQIRERLERITDEDLKILGINSKVARPEWTVLTVLPVPPSTTRPSITLETGERSEDDLTHKLVDILRINQRLADNISAGAPQLIIEDLWDLLQYHVTTYFNNEVSGIPPARHRSGRPLKTLFQRLKGKEGRFRYNLSGKRVNFSARTVISPDPNISVSEVGVPLLIAEELTTPEYVTEHNKEKLQKYIKNTEYPMASYIIRPDGRRKKVTELNREEVIAEIEPGFIVERQLVDGDIAIFNRQPSLHKFSMMGHYVKVLPGRTFRINDAVCYPYNADFDGDEMNLHVPQTEEAKTEVEEIMMVHKNILSSRTGKPLVGGDLDHITGAHLLTKTGQKYTKEQTMKMLQAAKINEMPEEDSKGMSTGKDIFSLIVPKTINLEYKSRTCRKCGTCDKEKCEFDSYVKIKRGKIISGSMDKEGMIGKLLEEIVKKTNPETARDFIDKSTKLGLEAIMMRGFTVSLADYDLSEDALRKASILLTNAEKKVDELIEQFRKGKLERMPGKTVEETLEDQIMSVLSQAREDCGRIVERDLGQDNSVVMMGKIGTKGNMLNVTQMTACIGQTALRGKRILRGYRNKTLPHFKEKDISAKARGFIRNSYVEGLSPIEYYFHSMSGRDGLVDKGINTAKSGYMQRRLINALIDISFKNDKTARDADGTIIQFKYGEDGLDPVKTKGNTIDIDKIISECDDE